MLRFVMMCAVPIALVSVGTSFANAACQLVEATYSASSKG